MTEQRYLGIEISLSPNYKNNKEIEIFLEGDAYLSASKIREILTNLFNTLRDSISDTEYERLVNETVEKRGGD